MRSRIVIAFVLTFSLLSLPLTVFAKKGDKNFKRGLDYEYAQQWDKAAQEFTLAVAADPSNVEYQLHFRRASFNASQTYMQQGRALAEQNDFVGAFNAFRQAYGYDPVNELAVSEMERMLRLQNVKDGKPANGTGTGTTGTGARPGDPQEANGNVVPTSAQAPDYPTTSTQQRVIMYTGDLKTFIRNLAEQLQLNVIFDRTTFAQSRPIDINLRDVTTAQALDYVFLQEGLFFQKLSRRTILVADQSRRPQYQQLVLRTFYLSNMKPTDARTLVQQAIPPSVGRPQTIVVPDDATNSLTVRDTAENVRLIGDLLQSVDKDRAEVVMDVNIYEVTRSNLMKFGNQIGQVGSDGTFSIGGSPGFSLLTDNGIVNSSYGRGVNLAALVGSVPTALAAALVLPPSTLYAFQSNDNSKLIASTQVHAFNGEESQARIGQRVPVQTAQAYPFGIQTGQPNPGQSFPSGGFPVINYEPTGLTLKFTPQVFPNLDVQVKMNIESKDVLGASSLTPTFTERTISGTARVQNNRTMLLASVSTEVDTEGRRGLPYLGGLPVLGRFFTAPTHDHRQIDIVISVTPRVLRAPAVTPRDEEMRPSGTLQSPTTGSLEAMIVEAERDERIAAARAVPRNVSMQLPDAPLPAAPKTNETLAANTQPATSNNNSSVTQPSAVATNATAPTSSNPAVATSSKPETSKPDNSTDELASFVPAPRSLVTNREAAELATVNAGTTSSQNAVLTTFPKPVDTSLNTKSNARSAQLSFLPTDDVIKVGAKRRFEIQLSSDVALSLAMFALKFDPKVLKVNSITAGSIFGLQPDSAPVINQSIDPTGICFISVSSMNKTPIKGSGSIIIIEVEAVGAGDASLVFDKETLHLIGVDARDVTPQLVQGVATAGR